MTSEVFVSKPPTRYILPRTTCKRTCVVPQYDRTSSTHPFCSRMRFHGIQSGSRTLQLFPCPDPDPDPDPTAVFSRPAVMAVKFEFWFAQTSHLVAFVCTLIVVVVLSTMQGVDLGSAGMFTMCVRTAHLASFGTWLGAQVWVTFFAGLTMYQYLPRHIFGYIQSKLFPKYFTLGLILSTVTVVTFVIENPIATWGFQEKLQGGFLLLSLMVVLANMIYFTPVSTTTMFEKHKLEKEEHAGEAVGKIEDDKAVKLRKNPRYVELETKFRLLHTLASIANLLSLSAQAVHLWYLAGHLQDL